MKTSNIILLAIFATVLIWLTAGFITAKNKIKTFVDEHPEIIVQNDKEEERETIDLNPFQMLIVNGNGQVNIRKAKNYSFDQTVDGENKAEVKNDTLFIDLSGQECNLNVKTFNGIQINQSANVKIFDLEVDSFEIIANDASRLKMKDFTGSSLTVNANDKSKVRLRNVNKFNGMKAEFFLRENSQLEINNTSGMTLSVQKDSGAKYEDD